MFSHLTIGVTDFPKSLAFYTAVLEPLGLVAEYGSPEGPWAFWKHPDSDYPLFYMVLPLNEQPATAGNGQMTAFLAPSREAVDRFHAAALEQNGSDEGAPGLRPDYHEHFYGAYLRDPDGNKLCACCHENPDAPRR